MLAINEVAGPRFARTPNDAFAIAGPNNHLLCHLFMVATWATGGRVVFPSGSFDAKAFLVASESEEATHTAVVPTMVKQILAMRVTMDFKPALSYRNIVLGGSGVSPEVLNMCTRDLGWKSVEVFYGNTEGVLITSGESSALDLIEDVNAALGRWKPSCQVKICAPNSIEPISLGLPGELHFQSISLAEGYLGYVSEEFYHHEGEVWMRPGDQAVMTADGRIFIIGKYKDMMIGTFLRTRIELGGLLNDVSALQEQVLRDDKHTKLPGPLVHASLFELEAENCGAVLLNLHHAVTDASSLQLLCEDIDVALN